MSAARGDIMTDRFRRSIWLIDTAHRRAGAARDRRQPAASGRPTATGSPISPPPRAAARNCSCAGWRPARRSAITGLPDSPSSVAWSPDGRQIAYAMFVPDEGARLGPPQPRPEGAQWAEPLQVITAVTYRADGQGYLRAGYDQLFLVSSEGGAPRQLTYGPYNNGGPLCWTPDGRTILFSGNRSPELGARGVQHRNLRARRRLEPDPRAHRPQRPGRRARGVARRTADRLSPAMTTTSAATRMRSST